MSEKRHVSNVVEHNGEFYVVYSEYDPVTVSTAKSGLENFLETQRCPYNFTYHKCDSRKEADQLKIDMFEKKTKQHWDEFKKDRKESHGMALSMLGGILIAMLILGFIGSIASAIFPR